MADRDWDKELAKIDKQLASLPDEAQAPAPTAKGQPPAAKGKAVPAAAPTAERTPRAWAVYARLLLAVALGVGMIVWPYEARCGAGLAAYLASVGVLVTSGVWSAVWTWRHRAAKAHLLSLVIVLWGLVLGAMDVLPRVGYAKPNASHPAGWICQ